jgi:hypothetical protein
MIDRNLQGVWDALAGRLEAALAASALAAGLRRLSEADSRLRSGRPLTADERLRLESQGNSCSDWSRITLGGVPGSGEGLAPIRGNLFEGDVFLAGFHGAWPGPDGREWPAGLTGCRVRDAVIGNACLHQIARLERQVIEDGAILVGLGELTCPSPTSFSLGAAIHPGAETGVRTLWLWDGLDLNDAMAALSLGAEAQRAFQARVDGLAGPLRSAFGFVGRGACVMHARQVQGAYLGPGSQVSGASLLRGTALLSVPAAAGGTSSVTAAAAFAGEDAWIENSILMPGARVESAGKVSRSLLLEKSAVAWGGMVSQSVLGPETQVHKGEVTASVLGPFVGFHHQSLLISALWPEGRGNIAYGANVGSNHTGKKPDQEIRPGEGNFFGLSCSIKFPANFEDAPYSLIATGVSTPPQRVAFPFSLINQPVGDAPAGAEGRNEIVPGWMWSDNAYSLARRGYKTGGGGGFFDGRIFAADLARKVLKARQALRLSLPGKSLYFEDSVSGLGGNFLRSSMRERALAAYEDYLSFFLMRTYADCPGETWETDLSDMVTLVRKELAVGLPAVPGAREWTESQRVRLQSLKENMLGSLSRDERRGRKIFDDYADLHPGAEGDVIVARVQGDLEVLREKLEAFVQMPQNPF